MGCCGERERGPPEKKQRWAYIELNDFNARSCWTFVGYGWLWFLGFVSVVVYGLDTFTAVNLLAFNRWSSAVQPAVPFGITKWIFSICIMVSWALLFYEFFRAWRVVKKDGVAASYMDPLAQSLQSMRSKGWKRFLVFTELTKSKKGTDYIAFFVYFAFQGALRIVAIEGPRQFVNAVTLYAVMQADLINGPSDPGNSSIEQFFINIKTIADQNYQQAMIYASMTFTLVIWVFSAVCLICAGILYLLFLWHYIPQEDGRLRIYLRRKIDRRLEKLVAEKYGTWEAEEAKRREKAEKKAELKRQRTGELPPPPPPSAPGIQRAPTLPDLGDSMDMKKDSSLSRQDTKSTVATLPLYSTQPSDRPLAPARNFTNNSGFSNTSYESDAPLLSNTGFMGADGRVPSPAPAYYAQNPSSASLNRPPPLRTNTADLQDAQRTFFPVSMTDSMRNQQRSFTPISATSSRGGPGGQRLPIRSNTGESFASEPRSAISAASPIDSRGMPQLARKNTSDAYRPAPQRQGTETSYFSRPAAGGAPPPPMDRMPTADSVNPPWRGPTPIPTATRQPQIGRKSSFSRPFTPQSAQIQPLSAGNSYEMISQQSRGFVASPTSAQGVYRPFDPHAHSGVSTPVSGGPRRNVTIGATQDCQSASHVDYAPPRRNLTAPVDARAESSYGSILDGYAGTSDDYGAPASHQHVSSREQWQPQSQSGWQGRY